MEFKGYKRFQGIPRDFKGSQIISVSSTDIRWSSDTSLGCTLIFLSPLEHLCLSITSCLLKSPHQGIATRHHPWGLLKVNCASSD